MQILTQGVHYLQANVVVLVEELQQILPFNHGDMGILYQVSSNLIRTACQSRAKSQNFPRSDHSNRHALTGFGANR